MPNETKKKKKKLVELELLERNWISINLLERNWSSIKIFMELEFHKLEFYNFFFFFLKFDHLYSIF